MTNQEILDKLQRYEIPTYIKRRFWLEKANDLTKAEIDLIFDTLKEFLYLAGTGHSVYLSSYIVDEAWHTFILFTRKYHDFCNEVFGKYIHHAPSISENGYKDDKKEIIDTYILFKKEFPKSYIFELDNILNIYGSEYKGIITIKEDNNSINVFLNNKEI